MKPKPPDEEVVERVAEVLAQAQLLPSKSISKLRARLLDGKMTAEDWKFFLEPAHPKGEGHVD